jgi:drug/metabolite transporter (DMT)-like permease
LIRRGEVSRAAQLIYLVPPTAAMQAWLLFGEQLSPLQLAGMALTVIGVALASRAA